MIPLKRKKVEALQRGFGLIEIMLVLVLILVLYTMRARIFGKSAVSPIENIEQQIAIKKNIENQVKDIQKIAAKRYQE